MDEYFHTLTAFQVLICRQCRYGVWPRQVAGHLAGIHHQVPLRQAGVLQQEAIKQNIIQAPGDFPLIHHLDRPLPELILHPSGYVCMADPECDYVAVTDKSLQTHCAQQHPGVRRRHAYRQGKPTEPWEPAACQRMFPSGHGSNYFRIREVTPTLSTPIDAIAAAKQQVADAHAELTNRTAQQIHDRAEGTESSPWLETVGWPKHLVDLDRSKLMASVETPRPKKEPLVHLIWDAMDTMLAHCQQTVQDASHFIRMEVQRTDSQPKTKPLRTYQDDRSVEDNARPWKQIVAFFVRTRRHRNRQPHYDLGEQEKLYFRQMIQQARRIRNRQVRQAYRGERQSSSSVGSDSSISLSGTDSEASSQGDPAPAASVRLTGLPIACLRFCLALLGRRVQAHEYELPILGALAVLGVTDQGWRSPGEYSPVLSRVIKMAKFMVVQAAYQQVPLPGDPPREEPPSPPLVLVTRMVSRFMVRGSHCAMQWILDRRAYAMTIQYTSTAPGHIDWVGDQIRYKKIELTMDQLRGMIHGLVTQAMDQLAEVLATPVAEFPHIPWDQLRDDATREGMGHNFVADERNPWPVDGSTWLIHRLIEGGQLRHCRQVIHPAKAQKWLETVDRFRALLLLAVHMTSGQPARGPEILSIRHSSSGEGEGRNIFIEDGAVVFVTRYHKGYNVSGDLKVIHRYPPREVGALLIWYIWLVFPALERIQATLRPNRSPRQWQVWSADAAGHPWTSSYLTRDLKELSLGALGQEITIASWRAISIAISRRYLRDRSSRDEEATDSDDDPNDLQAGHGTHVAGIVYAREIREQGGVVASTREKFRQASENWQRLLGFEIPNQRTQSLGKRRRQPPESDAQGIQWQRQQQLEQVDLLKALKVMMQDESAQFRRPQQAIITAIMQGAARVLAIMPTGGGKSLLFMLPAFCSQGVSIVVVPLIALKQDLLQRCSKAGIRCQAWNRRQSPDNAQIVLVTPEACSTDDFVRFVNRIKAQGRLDRIVIDECHVVLNEQTDFRPQLQTLGELNNIKVPIVMLTATLPVQDEARFLERMWLREEEVRIFREATTRPTIRYATHVLRATTSRLQEEELLRLIQERQKVLVGGDKIVVYGSRVEDCQRLADTLGCEAYFHHQEDKTGVFQRFVSTDASNSHHTIVATSAFGMGIDVPHIRFVIHVSEPRTLFDYSQESGRAGRDGEGSEVIVICGRMKGQGHTAGALDARRELVQQYLEAKCQRQVLDAYLDGRTDRQECGEGEEPCMGCERQQQEREQREAADPPSNTSGATSSNFDLGISVQSGVDPSSRINTQITVRRQQQVQGASKVMQQVRQVLFSIRGHCAYCFITTQGVDSSEHDLFHCREGQCRPIQQQCQAWKQQISRGHKMAKYVGCFYCLMPQAWCDRWQEKVGAGRSGMYELVGRGPCQGQDVVMETMAVLLAVEKGFQEQMQRRLPPHIPWGEVTQYWGQRAQWGGMDCFRMIVELGEGLRLRYGWEIE